MYRTLLVLVGCSHSLIGKVMDDKNKKNPLKRMGAKPLVLGFRFGLIRASS